MTQLVDVQLLSAVAAALAQVATGVGPVVTVAHCTFRPLALNGPETGIAPAGPPTGDAAQVPGDNDTHAAAGLAGVLAGVVTLITWQLRAVPTVNGEAPDCATGVHEVAA